VAQELEMVEPDKKRHGPARTHLLIARKSSLEALLADKTLE